MKKIEDKKKICNEWFKELRNSICKELEAFENTKIKFKKTEWNRDKKGTEKFGGGEMSVLRGNIFEKAGVNISTVFGPLSKELKGKIPGSKNIKNFWASGISVVVHPQSPQIPAVHMNTRFIVTEKSWFGGGADITPTNLTSKQSKKLAKLFHNNFKKICESSKKGSYKTYKKWCDEYFFTTSHGTQGTWWNFLTI